LRQLRHRGQLEASLLRHAVIEFGLVEAAHDQHPLHSIALSAEVKFTVVTLSDGYDFEIKLRCRAEIAAKLVEQRGPPALQGREVEEWVFDGAFDLVGMRSGKKYQGSVGLDAVDWLRCRVIGGGRTQEIKHLCLIEFDLLHGCQIIIARLEDSGEAGNSAKQPHAK
jgi:hypothetical protein